MEEVIPSRATVLQVHDECNHRAIASRGDETVMLGVGVGHSAVVGTHIPPVMV